METSPPLDAFLSHPVSLPLPQSLIDYLSTIRTTKLSPIPALIAQLCALQQVSDEIMNAVVALVEEDATYFGVPQLWSWLGEKLQYTEPTIVEEAAYLVTVLANRDIYTKARLAYTFPQLIDLLQVPDPDVRKSAAEAISALADDVAVRSQLALPIPNLLLLTSAEHVEISEAAIHALIKLAPNAIDVFVQEKGIETTIGLLHSSVQALYASALALLHVVIYDASTVNIFMREGGYDKVGKLVAFDQPTVRIKAVQLLGQIYNISSAFGECQLVRPPMPTLLQLLPHSVNILTHSVFPVESVDLLMPHLPATLPLLSRLATENKYRTRMKSLNATKAIVEAKGWTCVGVLMEDAIFRTELASMNIMETLQRGLEDDNPVNSKREMAFALSRGCIDPNLRPASIIPVLVKMFAFNDIELCRNAIWAIGNAVSNASHMEAFLRAGGWDELQDVLRDDAKGPAHGVALWVLKRLMFHSPTASWCFQNKIVREQSLITSNGYSQMPPFMDSRPLHPTKRQRPYYPSGGILIEPEKDEKLSELLNNCFRHSQECGWMRKKDKVRVPSAHPPTPVVVAPTGKGSKEKQTAVPNNTPTAISNVAVTVEKDVDDSMMPWNLFTNMIRSLVSMLSDAYYDSHLWRRLIIWKCMCDRISVPCEVWREAYGGGGSFVWGSEGKLEVNIDKGINHSTAHRGD